MSTVDAWLTPHATFHHVVEGGGDSVMIVKGNPPQVPHEIRLVCHESTALAETMTACDPVDHGHGRREARRLTASTALMAYRHGPGLTQVCPIERRVTVKQSGVQRAAVVYGATRLSPDHARPERLWRVVRQHWPIEHQVHGGRAVTCDEDRSHVRCGSIPQVMAAWRHTTMGLRHWTGEPHIAAACRRFAAQPWLT